MQKLAIERPQKVEMVFAVYGKFGKILACTEPERHNAWNLYGLFVYNQIKAAGSPAAFVWLYTRPQIL